MKLLLNTLLLILTLALSAAAQEEAELVNKVKAKLAKVHDYKAEGRMRIDVSFIDAPPSKVLVYYKKPDRFRVKKDGGISIIPKGGISINLNTLLAGQEYDLVPGKDVVLNGKSLKVVKMLPREESGEVVLTTLFIDDMEFVVRKAIVTTRENGSYEIEMTYGKYSSWGLPDKVIFSFNTKDYKLPKGITFEYEKGEKKKAPDLTNKKGKVEITYSTYTINKGIDDKVFAEN